MYIFGHLSTNAKVAVCYPIDAIQKLLDSFTLVSCHTRLATALLLTSFVIQDLRAALALALEMTGSKSREVWKPYWSAQQRFFKLLCVSVKVSMSCHTIQLLRMDLSKLQ